MKITFQTIPKGKNPPNKFQYVNCHMMFGINMEDFHRKACLLVVVGGHMTHTNCITLTMVALHDLEFKSADVLNTYVKAHNREITWTVLGPEFGEMLISLP